ncbi:MAG: hypothetical protein K1X65_18095 [Caldilineales bacterium]|nr:hypothetical protein [Caldilineales bacterium]MCW5858019.1 hypothetical protein [Caldilineales bacterium]
MSTSRLKQPSSLRIGASLGRHQPAVDLALTEMDGQDIIRRIWDHDPTVWRQDPTEISNRLGWLHLPGSMASSSPALHTFAAELAGAGFSHVLLLGMGGSSLAPEVFASVFGLDSAQPPAGPALRLQVLDSTHPDAVLAKTAAFDPARTLYIVSTKSGGTVETFSFLRFFYNQVESALGKGQAGAHFAATTDPGSKLAEVAQAYNFRRTFLNDPTIGGRYSALSFFGLAPAALVGVDVARLLEQASAAAAACRRRANNPAARLGAILAELAKQGRDKVTFVISPDLASFGDWVEQLIAESTGKEGKGILPVVGEALGRPESYGPDRLFVQIKLAGDAGHDAGLRRLARAGHPLVRIDLNDRYELGAQFFLWEMATAVAGHRLDIQPFDQPNVESAKVLARKMVAAFQETGSLPPEQPAFSDESTDVFGSWPVTRRPLRAAADVLIDFLRQVEAGDYLALQAYVQPTPAIAAALADLRQRLRQRYHTATTVGFGPRFLHSTGQLHKGDAGRGLFLQFTDVASATVAIPDEAGAPASSISFAVLVLAQALGDRQALVDNQRRVLRFHFRGDAEAGLRRLAAALG